MLAEYMESHECEVKRLIDDNTEGMRSEKVTNAKETDNDQYIIREPKDREKYMVTLKGK